MLAEKLGELKGMTVMPNDQELEYWKKCGMSGRPFGLVLVRNRNYTRDQLANVATDVGKENERIRELRRESALPVLFVPTYKQGTKLTPEILTTFDSIQAVDENEVALVEQISCDVSVAEFSARIDSARKNLKGKELICVIDPASKDVQSLRAKVQVLKQQNVRIAAVRYRNPKKYYGAWQVIVSACAEAKIPLLCVGIHRRWFTYRDTPETDEAVKVSTLCLAARLGCIGAGHGRPWRGGPGLLHVLEEQLIYVPASKASEGNIYGTQTRANLLGTLLKELRYPFARVDALVVAQRQLSLNSNTYGLKAAAEFMKGASA